VDRDAYEQHLVECDPCSHACRLQSRFKAAVRGHLPRPALPDGLRARLELALTTEPPIRRRWLWQAYPRLVPAAAAAVALFALLGVARSSRRPSMVLEQAARTYHAGLPMDVQGPSCTSVLDWFRGKVDFAVPQPPADLGTCQGGRVVNVQDRFGVYDGDDEGLSGARRRTIGGRDVYVDSVRGSSTAAYRDRNGLMYVVTSDWDEDALSTYVERALLQR
jgi:hypothetical protein